MPLQTVDVICDIYDQEGLPLDGATVNAELDKPELDRDSGAVIPKVTSGDTVVGTVTLPLWPNTLGDNNSKYIFSVLFNGVDYTLGVKVVPHLDDTGQPIVSVNLQDL